MKYICLKCEGTGRLKTITSNSFLTFIDDGTESYEICPTCKGEGEVKTKSRRQQIAEVLALTEGKDGIKHNKTSFS